MWRKNARLLVLLPCLSFFSEARHAVELLGICLDGFFSVVFLWWQNADSLDESVPYWGHIGVSHYIWVYPRAAGPDWNYV